MIKSRFYQTYLTKVLPVLSEEFGIKNKLAIPRIEKVVINAGIGEIAKNKENLEATIKDLATITGQKPAIRKARVSIASFSLRQGMVVGLKVTLRGERMYSFLDKLFSITLPRLRDFRGVSSGSIDKSGNYTLGVTDHTIFPDIDPARSARAFGFEITIVTGAANNETTYRLLELMGMPFAKKEKKDSN